jgi:hypothetical protein
MLQPFSIARLPRIEFGAGAIVKLPDIIAQYGNRVLLVTGQRSFVDSPRWPTLLAALEKAGIGWEQSVDRRRTFAATGRRSGPAIPRQGHHGRRRHRWWQRAGRRQGDSGIVAERRFGHGLPGRASGRKNPITVRPHRSSPCPPPPAPAAKPPKTPC